MQWPPPLPLAQLAHRGQCSDSPLLGSLAVSCVIEACILSVLGSQEISWPYPPATVGTVVTEGQNEIVFCAPCLCDPSDLAVMFLWY